MLGPSFDSDSRKRELLTTVQSISWLCWDVHEIKILSFTYKLVIFPLITQRGTILISNKVHHRASIEASFSGTLEQSTLFIKHLGHYDYTFETHILFDTW